MFVIFSIELHHEHSDMLPHYHQYFRSFQQISARHWYRVVAAQRHSIISTSDARDFLLQSASKTVVVGSHVWVEDPEIAWKAGEVEAVKDKEITVKCTTGDTVSKRLINAF